MCWQDAQDVLLEQERDRMLTLKLVTLQKVIRGWHHRRRFSQMKWHCVTLQNYIRSFLCAMKYRQVAYLTLVVIYFRILVRSCLVHALPAGTTRSLNTAVGIHSILVVCA